MKKIVSLFLLLCVGTLAVAHERTEMEASLQRSARKAQEANRKVNVACELNKDGKYQLSTPQECLQDADANKEVTLLGTFLADLARNSTNTTYDTKYLGTVNLSEQIFKQTFLVNHGWRAITERFMGFGPEDDPAFDYTQPDYYPQGTIKVNLTERAFDVIRLYYGDILPTYGSDSAPARGLRGFLGMVFFHEMMHGWQLHTKPVLDYKRLDIADLNAMLSARQPDKKIVRGSEQIVNYEEDANVFTYHYMADVYNDFSAFVEVFKELCPGCEDPEAELDSQAQEQKDKFLAKYPRLGDTFYPYYLANQLKGSKAVLDELESGKKVDTFNELNTYTYRGQVAPLQAWAFMVKVNDGIKGEKSCRKAEAKVREQYDYFMNLAEPTWNGRDASNPDDAIIMDTIKKIDEGYSGLPEIKAAARKEFKTFEEKCGIRL